MTSRSPAPTSGRWAIHFLPPNYETESEREGPEIVSVIVVLHHHGIALLEKALQTEEADGMQVQHGSFLLSFLCLCV